MSKQAQTKTVHESFARFFESPTRETLRDLLKMHVGELRNCDFKESWPDHAATAKHILGLGNAGGGCLVVGVKEENDCLIPCGLPALKDKADINNGINLFLPAPLSATLEIGDFGYDAAEYPTLIGKRFQVLFVDGRPEDLPFVAQRAGIGIRAGAIYIRREGVTQEASHNEVQELLDRRLAASPQTREARNLKDHLEELKVLHGEIPKKLTQVGLLGLASEQIFETFYGISKPNPRYPVEDYEAFVLRMIAGKKELIKSLLGIG